MHYDTIEDLLPDMEGAEPGSEAAIAFEVVAGRLLRRHVVGMLSRAQVLNPNLKIVWAEDKGWIESTFAIRIVGPVEEARGLMVDLAAAMS